MMIVTGITFVLIGLWGIHVNSRFEALEQDVRDIKSILENYTPK
jgi:hypothetical protein